VRLLVCVDFSPVTAGVVEQASLLARALGAEVRLLHVGAPDPDFVGYQAGPATVRDGVARALRDEHRALEDLAERLRAAGVDVKPLMVQGPTRDAIVEQARTFRADMIVLGSHGHGALFNLLVGSVAEGVLHAARVPVLVVPSKPAP